MKPPRKASDPLLIEDLIRRRRPHENQKHVRELATLWAAVVDEVLDAMADATDESGRVAWPYDARAELVFEIAQLYSFTAGKVLDDRLGERDLASIDPIEERTYLASQHSKERARNTGRIFAEQIWNRLHDKYTAKYPLLINSDSLQPFIYKTRKGRNGPSAGVKRNHYLPVLANKPWSDSNGDILVARHWVDGKVRIDKRAFRNWGYEKFLYPQWLESYFHAVESDAALGYRHLLNTVPLPPDERRMFTSFLVLQMLRTPAFIARLGLGLRRTSAHRGWSYPTDAGFLRRAYETIFRNDQIHALLHARMSRRQWRMLRPGGGWVFPRTDSGIVTITVSTDRKSALLFPLSPDKCLCIGPNRAPKGDPPFPLSVQLDESDTIDLVGRMVSVAVHSVALPCGADVPEWSALLTRHMSTGITEEIARYRAWGRLHEI